MVIGCDLAYSDDGAGDWTVLVPMADIAEPETVPPKYKIHILDLVRVQVALNPLRAMLYRVQQTHPGAPIVSYVNGPEKRIIHLLAEKHITPEGAVLPGVYITGMLAKFPKFVRAQALSEAWAEGLVVLPPGRPWTIGLQEKVTAFTGKPGDDDDVVDALVSGYDYLIASRPAGNDIGAFRFGRAAYER
ncbi:MAG TPA: hypothetical protein VF881_01765 [Polyangiaceae bacterium]